MSLKLKWRDGVAYIHGTIEGKRIRRSLGTRDPKIAEALKAKEEARLWRAATYGIEHEATFAEACVHYLKAQSPKRNYLVPIIRKIGKQRLANIKPGQIRMLAKELYPQAKPQTWNRQVIAPVCAVINFAHEIGLCHPVRIKRFTPKDEKIKRAVDRAWINRFRAHASPHMAAYALFIHTTAARPSEALLLRPQDLDLDNQMGLSRIATKNGSFRQFWLTEEMANELKTLPPRKILFGKYCGELRLFGWHDGSGVARLWRRTCEAAGLEYVTPYEAGRHSFATEAITRQDRNVVMVAKTGNWKNTATLLKNYAHPEDIKTFVEEVYGAKPAPVRKKRPPKSLRLIKK